MQSTSGTANQFFHCIQKFLCLRVGLPITLSDLNVSATEENIRVIAKKTVENHLIHSEPVVITEDVVYNAIAAADIIGRQYKQRVNVPSTQPNSLTNS